MIIVTEWVINLMKFIDKMTEKVISPIQLYCLSNVLDKVPLDNPRDKNGSNTEYMKLRFSFEFFPSPFLPVTEWWNAKTGCKLRNEASLQIAVTLLVDYNIGAEA